jgi:hypothetical protein
MSLTIPYSFIPLTKAKASEVNSNFQAVAGKFTEGPGGIANVDIATGAGIVAAKLSSVVGSRITQAQLEDDAVDSRVLKSDAGGITGAVGSADHIANGIITPAKIVPASIAKDRLKVTEVTQAFSYVFGFALANTVLNREVIPVPPLPAMAAMLPLRCTMEAWVPVGCSSNGVTVNVLENAAGVRYFVVWEVNAAGAHSITGTIRFTYLALT